LFIKHTVCRSISNENGVQRITFVGVCRDSLHSLWLTDWEREIPRGERLRRSGDRLLAARCGRAPVGCAATFLIRAPSKRSPGRGRPPRGWARPECVRSHSRARL